jgi:hypothetical protein
MIRQLLTQPLRTVIGKVTPFNGGDPRPCHFVTVKPKDLYNKLDCFCSSSAEHVWYASIDEEESNMWFSSKIPIFTYRASTCDRFARDFAKFPADRSGLWEEVISGLSRYVIMKKKDISSSLMRCDYTCLAHPRASTLGWFLFRINWFRVFWVFAPIYVLFWASTTF